MKYISLCSGLGGFEVALHRVFPNAECVGYCEIDEKCRRLYQHHFPIHPLLGNGDLSKVDFTQCGDVDLVVGGFPCQDLSSFSPNKTLGLKGKKSSLFKHVVRCLQEVKPKYFLIENVASMSREYRDEISAKLGVQPIMLDAGSFTAQTRKRFFWANFVISAAPPAEDYMVLENQLDIDLDLMHSLALPEQRVRSLHKKVKSTGKPRYLQFRKHDSKERTSRTVSADKQGQILIDHRFDPPLFRFLTLDELHRLQGFPEGWTNVGGVSDSAQRKALGNAVCVPVVEHACRSLREVIEGEESEGEGEGEGEGESESEREKKKETKDLTVEELKAFCHEYIEKGCPLEMEKQFQEYQNLLRARNPNQSQKRKLKNKKNNDRKRKKGAKKRNKKRRKLAQKAIESVNL